MLLLRAYLEGERASNEAYPLVEDGIQNLCDHHDDVQDYELVHAGWV